MKNYSSIKRGSSRQPYLPKKVKIVIAIVALSLTLYFVLPKLVASVIAVAMYPIESLRVWVVESNDSLPRYLRERHALVTELDNLKQSVATMEGNEHTIAKLQAENEEFRRMLGAVPDERILARVVGRPADLPYDVLMLDRGQVDGVVEGAPVFVGSDQVIGYVARVYEHTTLVTLVTTAGFESIAYIIGPNIYTYAEGIGGGMMRVRVPQGIPLRSGDTVILPAIDSGVYGAISEVVSSPTEPEQSGYVPLPVSLQSMQYVSIGKQTVTPHSYEEAEVLVEKIRSDLFTVNLPEGVLVTPEAASTTATSTLPNSAVSTTTSGNTVE